MEAVLKQMWSIIEGVIERDKKAQVRLQNLERQAESLSQRVGELERQVAPLRAAAFRGPDGD